ncbi:MAG: hypothetical protein QOE22_111 [Candidatus Parcubacteria bacterium]|jgi:hypothetical protein|nr:hypothetical protein [Candidatus Parcubacteria bacterium]
MDTDDEKEFMPKWEIELLISKNLRIEGHHLKLALEDALEWRHSPLKRSTAKLEARISVLEEKLGYPF